MTSDAGTTLSLDEPGVTDIMKLSCLSGPARMRLHVSGFRPIGSEERISFGAGGDPYVFVAQLDAQGPGVAGEREITITFLDALNANQLWRINYGVQDTGPFSAPPVEEMRRLAAACHEILFG